MRVLHSSLRAFKPRLFILIPALFSVLLFVTNSRVASQELLQQSRIFLPFVATNPWTLSFTDEVSKPIARANGIAQIDQFGGNRVQLTTFIDRFSSWAPDGQRFVVVNQTDSTHALVIVSRDGTQRQHVFVCPQTCAAPSWSPTEPFIVFGMLTAPESTTSAIFRIRTDGTDLTQLTSGERDEQTPSWSPDGTKIAYAARGPQETLATVEIIDREGRTIRSLQTSRPNVSHPSWSPDGNQLVFAALQELFTIHEDGTQLTPLPTGTSAPVFVNDPVWSPDGNFIAYTSFTVGTSSIAIITMAGTDYRVIASGSSPEWIPILQER